MQSLSGAIGIKGHYRDQLRIMGSGFEEKIQGTLLSGEFHLESHSSIIKPGLIDLDMEIAYNPEKMDEQYTSIPDRSDVRTLNRLNMGITLLQEKIITLSAFVNLNRSFINRENFSNSRTNRQYFGGGLFYKNKVLPFSVTYLEGKWDQEEIETGRTYSYWQRNIKSQIIKSFFSFDKHRLNYSYDDYINKESYSPLPRRNVIHDLALNSSIYFDVAKKKTLTTIISNYSQKGINALNKFQVTGNLNMKLPQNFMLHGNYNFFDTRYTFNRINQHRVRLDLGHQLFKSLRTNIISEYAYAKHSIYQEDDYRFGFDFKYTKKIPLGVLNVSYAFIHRNFKHNGDPVPLEVINEEHVLSDDQFILLDKAYAVSESIVVKDITGIIVYQLNFDYLLFEQNNYIEIKRIPGGQIPNNATILVDYISLLSGVYKFNSNNQSFLVSVLLFHRLLELYYRRGKQDYSNVETAEKIALNYYLRNVYGVIFNINVARFGIEYDHYISSIIPYQLIRFFITLNWRFGDKLMFSLAGNTRYYLTIGNRENELLADVTGKLAYSFNSQFKLNMQLGYRDQQGYQMDLDYLTARSELTMIVRKIYITAGIEVYRRNYLNRETINFNGAYVSITRKFKTN